MKTHIVKIVCRFSAVNKNHESAYTNGVLNTIKCITSSTYVVGNKAFQLKFIKCICSSSILIIRYSST